MYGNGSVDVKGPGMSPRKEMASGGRSGSGVTSYPGTGRKAHPDATMGVGEKGAMSDGMRGVGMPVSRGGDHHPSQAAPDHGPALQSKMGNSYGGKI